MKCTRSPSFLIICISFLCLLEQIKAENDSESNKQEKVIIPENFAMEPPSQDLNLHLDVIITELKLNESELTCNISTGFILRWDDFRLWDLYNSNPTSHPIDDTKINTSLIWRPRIILKYDGEFYKQTDRYEDVHRYNDHAIFDFSRDGDPEGIRLSTKGLQWMILHSKQKTFEYFPGDTHTCELNVTLTAVQGAVGHFAMFTWEAAETDSLFTINFQHREVASDPASFWVPDPFYRSNNTFIIRIIFARKHGYSLIQTYLPSVFFVAVGLLSFLLPVEIASDRVSICIGILLTLTIFLNTARMEGPSVNYLRALDYWLVGCIGFVFLTLFLNIVILRMTANKSNKTKPAIGKLVHHNASLVLLLGGGGNAGTGDGTQMGEEGQYANETEKDQFRIARRLNKMSSMVFVTAFVLGNAAYFFTMYAHGKVVYGEDEWTTHAKNIQ